MLKLFYRAKWLKHEKKNTAAPIYTAFLSVVLCMVCLAGTTWAWFTAGQEVRVMPIVAAERKIDRVELHELSGSDVQRPVNFVVMDHGIEFTAEANALYEVNITASGTSSKGFIVVQVGDDMYYEDGVETSFHLRVSETSTVVIGASWGVIPEGITLIDEGEWIGDGTNMLESSEEESMAEEEPMVEEETTAEEMTSEEVTTEEATTEEATTEEATTEEVATEAAATEEAATMSDEETSVEESTLVLGWEPE